MVEEGLEFLLKIRVVPGPWREGECDRSDRWEEEILGIDGSMIVDVVTAKRVSEVSILIVVVLETWFRRLKRRRATVRT